MFSGSIKGMPLRPKSAAVNVHVEPGEKGFTVTAHVTGDPPIYAAVAYMDPAGGSDYDATTATAVPDARGQITLNCNALTAGKTASLRTVLLHCNGAISEPTGLQLSYDVDKNGKPDLSSVQAVQALAPMVAAINARNLEQARGALVAIDSAAPSPLVLETARVLLETIGSEKRAAPAAVEGTRCWLSDCAPKSASAGWGRPVANRIPDDSALLTVAGKLHARGLYAHAPAKYEYNLGGKWNTFTAAAGLADGHAGTVVFVVKGDGKELFRSKTIKEGTRLLIDVAVKDVKALELIVENADDGNGSDWGLWLDPEVTR